MFGYCLEIDKIYFFMISYSGIFSGISPRQGGVIARIEILGYNSWTFAKNAPALSSKPLTHSFVPSATNILLGLKY